MNVVSWYVTHVQIDTQLQSEQSTRVSGLEDDTRRALMLALLGWNGHALHHKARLLPPHAKSQQDCVAHCFFVSTSNTHGTSLILVCDLVEPVCSLLKKGDTGVRMALKMIHSCQ